MPSEQGPDGMVFTQDINTGGGQLNAVVGADQYNYIYRGRPPYRVEPFDPAARVVPLAKPGWVRSRLLAARHQAAPSVSWPKLEMLESWRDDSSLALSVRLLHGEGEPGKTRLASRFAVASIQAGWTVAVARRRGEAASASGPDERVMVRPPGLVMIVDHADHWPRGDLVTLIRQHKAAVRDRLRILLLGQHAGTWWQGVTHQLAKLDVFDSAPWR
jgi:hypothetical protein